MIESLENMMKHGLTLNSDAADPSLSKILVTKLQKRYRIFTINYISNDHITDLKNRLDYLNGLDPVQLKNVYKETITNGEFTKSGGAGLGLIEMVKISGNPIDYRFVALDDLYTLYHQTVTIDEV